MVVKGVGPKAAAGRRKCHLKEARPGSLLYPALSNNKTKGGKGGIACISAFPFFFFFFLSLQESQVQFFSTLERNQIKRAAILSE